MGLIMSGVLLVVLALCGYLLVRDIRETAYREERLRELRRRREVEEVVTGRVADRDLLGWLPASEEDER